VDERGDQGAGAPVATAAPSPDTNLPDRRAERAAERRRRTRRGQAIAAVSTVVVFGVVTALILTSPGWPSVRDTFLDWEQFKDSFPDILKAFWLDIRVFAAVEVGVLVIGLVVALLRTVTAPALFPLKMLAVAYTDIFRGVPTVLVIVLVGFGTPAIVNVEGSGLGWLPTDPVVLGGIALALSYGAYVAEVYRAGLKSVHPGQRHAALAVGLSETQAMRHVVLPQAIRNVGPPLLNDFIALLKDIALLAFLGVAGEAFYTAQIDASTNFDYTPLVAAALIYLVLTIPLARLLDRWDARQSGRTH
jgi:polar amino acid transport system permease protein